MCAVYEICEVCDVDHGWENTVCPWPLAASTLFWLDLHPDHPHVPEGLEHIEHKVRLIVENPSFRLEREAHVHINPR